MSGGGELRRTAPLRSSSPTARAKVSPPAKSASKLEREAADRAAEREAKRLVRARSGGRCEVCGIAAATNFSHRKGAGQGGEWSAANGLDACGWGNTLGCHGRIHQRPEEAREHGWMLRRNQVPEEEPVDHAWLGRVLLTSDGMVIPAD
jgi:hypothetical protein